MARRWLGGEPELLSSGHTNQLARASGLPKMNMINLYIAIALDVRMRNQIQWLCFAIALCSPAFLETPSSAEEKVQSPLVVDPLDGQASEQRLRSDVEYLASEPLRGRGTDDDTIDLAADYLAEQMAAYGLLARDFRGGPFQSVSIDLGIRAGAAEQNSVKFSHPATDETFLTAELDDAMMPMAIGSSQGIVSGPLAFVGYGIEAPSLRYDDYQSVDVRGCVVMIIRKTPGFGNPDSIFGPESQSRHALFSRKIELAIKSGAAAVLLVNDPASTQQSVDQVVRRRRLEQERIQAIQTQIAALPSEANQTRVKLVDKIAQIQQTLADTEDEIPIARRGILDVISAGRRSDATGSIPVVSIGRDVANQLIAQVGGGQTLESVEALINQFDAQGYHQSGSFFLPKVRCRVEVSLTPSKRSSRNVIGIIEGRGNLASQTVVIGAHYDHVGMGGDGSLAPGTIAVHNGADDNASGTAAMIEVGRLLKTRLQNSVNCRRIMLVGFTGEERGLLGSQHFVKYSPIDLSQVQTMINLDMVGRLRDDDLTIYGTGSGTMLDSIVEDINVAPSMNPAIGKEFKLSKVATGYGPSDHQTFYIAGVPVLFFFTGLHNDYHRPSDDVEKLSFNGLVRIVEMVSEVAERLATIPQKIQYIAAERSNLPVPIRRQLNVRIGISMKRATAGPASGIAGVMVSKVSPEGPAQRAGINAGDVIIRLDKSVVRNPDDIIDALRQYDAGNKVSVVVIRGGAEITAAVTLEKR